MNKADINKLYALMFTEYPDIVGVKDLQKMLGIGRNLAYALVSDGGLRHKSYQRLKKRSKDS